MMYHVRHTTSYRYSEAVSVCHNELHLRPRHSPSQICHNYVLDLQPAPVMTNTADDYFGNHVVFFTIQEPHQRLTITANSTVEVRPRTWPRLQDTPPWEHVCEHLHGERSASSLDAYQYVFESPHVPLHAALQRYALPSFPPGRPLLEAVAELMRRIYTDFTYDPAATTISTPLRDVLEARRGVCQDFAHIYIGCLRTMGLAARYVSGYLVTQPPPGKPRLVGADASHAWVAVYCPGIGWIDVDPTNNVLPSEQHITVAVGRDYSDVSPIKGVFLGGGLHTMNVAVDVTPVAGN